MSDDSEFPGPDHDDASTEEEAWLDEVDPLSRIVEQEAHRILSEAHLEPDPELIAQGWERRFMTDARRVKEAVELYEEMGYEVHTQPVQPVELADDCDGCRLVVAFQFQTIYTRRPSE